MCLRSQDPGGGASGSNTLINKATRAQSGFQHEREKFVGGSSFACARVIILYLTSPFLNV